MNTLEKAGAVGVLGSLGCMKVATIEVHGTYPELTHDQYIEHMLHHGLTTSGSGFEWEQLYWAGATGLLASIILVGTGLLKRTN
jgi:hypothetical protein